MRCGETFSIGQAVSKEVRRSSITLRRDGLDAIAIRDQLPLKFLDECLEEGVATQDFLDALNGRVFRLAEERLQRASQRAGISEPPSPHHADRHRLVARRGTTVGVVIN